MTQQPSEAEAVAALQRHLGAEVWAVTVDGGWFVRRQTYPENFEQHALAFHRGAVATLEEHLAHHTHGIDPTRFVPHTHDPQEP